MTTTQVLRELESLGSEQTRKTYRRHGVSGDVYGVSYADLGKLKKRLTVDHDLARTLWSSGNHDARILATMIADAALLGAKDVDVWVRDLDNYVLTDAFAALAAKAPGARERGERWSDSDHEWTGRAGWLVLAHVAMTDQELPDEYFERHLETIERDIHTRKNRVRDAMNSALIAIGLRNDRLQKIAMDAAARIGTVNVDHGETSCKTPDAGQYIRRAAARKPSKRARARRT